MVAKSVFIARSSHTRRIRRQRIGGRNSERFESFCREYNEQRPRQAPGQQVPASIYYPLDRPSPAQLPEIEYPSSFPRRKVGQRGEIYWRGERIFVSEVLHGETLGLEAIADGIYRVWFCSLELGNFDERRGKLAPFSRRRENGACGTASAAVSSDPEQPNNSEPRHNPVPTTGSESTLTTPKRRQSVHHVAGIKCSLCRG